MAIGLVFSFSFSFTPGSKTGSTGAPAAGSSAATPRDPYDLSDAHDRAAAGQIATTGSYDLSDAHDRARVAYKPGTGNTTDASDRARAAQEYLCLKLLEESSDLNSRHTPAELVALFADPPSTATSAP